jgi:hypothetical protein
MIMKFTLPGGGLFGSPPPPPPPPPPVEPKKEDRSKEVTPHQKYSSERVYKNEDDKLGDSNDDDV